MSAATLAWPANVFAGAVPAGPDLLTAPAPGCAVGPPTGAAPPAAGFVFAVGVGVVVAASAAGSVSTSSPAPPTVVLPA